jgi:hypothetical protein
MRQDTRPVFVVLVVAIAVFVLGYNNGSGSRDAEVERLRDYTTFLERDRSDTRWAVCSANPDVHYEVYGFGCTPDSSD